MISVVIPTDGSQPVLLARAIRSVAFQDYTGGLEVVVATLDADEAVTSTLKEICDDASVACRHIDGKLSTEDVSRSPSLAVYAWSRVSYQRNLGAREARGEFIAHLDHDNEFAADHLGLLQERLTRSPEAVAAFSWRDLLWDDGSPYLLPLYPWPKKPNREQAAFIYDELVAAGVFVRGSHIMKDQLISEEGVELLTIDSSEWLIRKEFQLKVPFRERYEFREVSHALTGDLVYCRQLVEVRAKVVGSEAFTLKYYIGGVSTTWMSETFE